MRWWIKCYMDYRRELRARIKNARRCAKINFRANLYNYKLR